MKNKPHAVITRSNRDIGLALTKHYAQAGFDVTAICRTKSAEYDLIFFSSE